MCRPLFILVAFVFTSVSAHAQTNASAKSLSGAVLKKWSVEQQSSLQVGGRSNINSFVCRVPNYNRKDTLVLTANNKGGALGLHGEMVLPIRQFDCGNKLITGDLRQTLQAKQHPLLRVKFLSLALEPDGSTPRQTVQGWVEVELAGVKKLMQVPFHFVKAENNILQMHGIKSFCFSDFQLQPPTKLAGTVKIKDEFEVQFKLLLKEVD